MAVVFTAPNGWWCKVSPDGRYVLYGNGSIWCVDLTDLSVVQLVELNNPSRGWPAGWWDSSTPCWSEEIVLGADPRKLMKCTVGVWTPTQITTTSDHATGNAVLVSNGHWASWLAGVYNRVVYDDAVLTTGYGIALNGTWLVTSDPSNWYLEVYNAGVFVREIVPTIPVSPTQVTISAAGDVCYGSNGDVYVSLADGTSVHVAMSPRVRQEWPGPLLTYGGALWVWTGAWSAAEGDCALGRPVAANPTAAIQVVMPQTDLSVGMSATNWVLAGHVTTVGSPLTVATTSLSGSAALLPRTGSLANIAALIGDPPVRDCLRQAEQEQTPGASGGLMSRRWQRWARDLQHIVNQVGVTYTGASSAVRPDPATVVDGTTFWNTSRTVLYVVSNHSWRYVAGIYRVSTIADAPADLTLGDADFRMHVASSNHILRWTGTAWEFAPEDDGNGYYVSFGIAPPVTGWVVCDGNATTYLLPGVSLTEVSFTLPTVANQYFRR